MTLSFQLVDTYGNTATAAAGGVTLALTTTGNGFFSGTLNHNGGLTTANVSIASGQGTATEYYGSSAAGTLTVTAKVSGSTWGTTSVAFS